MSENGGAADKSGKHKSAGQARELIFSCLCSFILLLFCTRSSPLYPLNNWDDVNSYFSMGKAMMNGAVPYRDLFDQKGILLYFLYGIGYLISHTTFIGVFLIEWIAAALHLWAALKISILLTDRTSQHTRFICALLVPLYGVCVYSARCIWYGGSAEELMLPLFAWGLYLLLRVLEESPAHGETTADSAQSCEKDAPSTSTIFVTRCIFFAGILAGCVLHIKFNSLGFFFGWMAAVFFLRLKRDGLVRSLVHCLVFLGGMAAATLPWLVYFLIRGAVGDWFHVTIYLNLFVYSEKLPLLQRFIEMARTLLNHLRDNRFVFIPAIAGILWLIITRKVRTGQKIAVFLTGLFLTLGIFIGGVTLPYYPVPLTVYALFLIPALIHIVRAVIQILSPGYRHVGVAAGLYAAAAVAVAACCVGVFAANSLNRSFLGTKQEDLWQYRFRDDIRQSGIENPTLLNMNCFDVGLYTVADILPTCYFYQTQTIHLPDVHDRQLADILGGATDFVVACGEYTEGIDERYQMIDEASEICFGEEMRYYLYQKCR